MCEVLERSPQSRPVRFILRESGQGVGEYLADGIVWATGPVSVSWFDGAMETWPSWDRLIEFAENECSVPYVIVREDCCPEQYWEGSTDSETNCLPAVGGDEPEPAEAECPFLVRLCLATAVA